MGRHIQYLVAGHLAAALALSPHAPSSRVSRADQNLCGSVTTTFPQFVEMYGHTYELGSEEYMQREQIYNERAKAIGSHNCNPAGPWKADINHLSDWTVSELQGLLGHRP